MKPAEGCRVPVVRWPCLVAMCLVVSVAPADNTSTADRALLDEFEQGRLEAVVKERHFQYLYAEAFLAVRKFDVFQDVNYAVRASRLCRTMLPMAPDGERAEAWLLSAYAHLKAQQLGLALSHARHANELEPSDRARAIEAWALLSMSGARTHRTRMVDGAAVRREIRPANYPGKGPITPAERKRWAGMAGQILNRLLVRAPEGGSCLVYYIAGCARRAGVELTTDAPDLFKAYLAKADKLRSNYVRRRFVERILRGTNSKRADALSDAEDLFFAAYARAGGLREQPLVYSVIEEAAGEDLVGCVFRPSSVTVYYRPGARGNKIGRAHV